MYLKYWIRGKQCRLWSDAVFCSAVSDLALHCRSWHLVPILRVCTVIWSTRYPQNFWTHWIWASLYAIVIRTFIYKMYRHAAGKRTYWHLWTEISRISLCLRIVGSGPLLFTLRNDWIQGPLNAIGMYRRYCENPYKTQWLFLYDFFLLIRCPIYESLLRKTNTIHKKSPAYWRWLVSAFVIRNNPQYWDWQTWAQYRPRSDAAECDVWSGLLCLPLIQHCFRHIKRQ